MALRPPQVLESLPIVVTVVVVNRSPLVILESAIGNELNGNPYLALTKLIIHCTPNLSVNEPQYAPQNMSWIGISIFPPADRPLKSRSASSLVSGERQK